MPKIIGHPVSSGLSYNIYCDESCHLEHDREPVMVLGAVWCATAKAREIAERLREIKARHGVGELFEVKWAKVSRGALPLYRDLVDYFFDDDHLHFRALIAQKTTLDHTRFNQRHDEWYYKMYFEMLKALLRPDSKFRIYLDIKDTRGGEKVTHLWDVLCSSIYDFSRQVVERLQLVPSDEVEQIQLADLLIGAVSYVNRNRSGNEAKTAIVEQVKRRSRYSLTRSTLLREDKFNLFRWTGQPPEQ